MARFEIELPDRFLFQTEIPIRVDDINYGGHLGNDRVLTIVHEARVRFLASHGFTELDVAGVGMIMLYATVLYLAEGTLGMVLRVEVAADDVRTRGFDLVYRLTDAATGREVARVRTGLRFFDYAARKIVHMPESFRAVLGAAPA
jgi:acyl-CoA thioesterase FadM